MIKIASSARVGAGVATGSLSNNKSSSADWSGGRTGWRLGTFGTFCAAEEDDELAPARIAFALGVGHISAAGIATGTISQTSHWLRDAGNLTNSGRAQFCLDGHRELPSTCLLYTSDAADDTPC
eukprot:6748516-Pyramimonas_sp.AAC.1